MYSLNHNWAKFEYSTSTDTDIWRQNLSILSSTSVSLWRHQNCYVYTWNAKASMYLFHSDLGNTVHDSIFGETTSTIGPNEQTIFRMHRAYQPLTPANNIYLRQRWDQEFYEEHRKKISLGWYLSWKQNEMNNVIQPKF